MIVYTVDLDVDVELAAEYLPWLRGHVREMLTLPGFVDAQIFERVEPQPDNGHAAFSVHYRLRDRAAFNDYLRERAPGMRKASARFGDRVRASRGLLKLLK